MDGSGVGSNDLSTASYLLSWLQSIALSGGAVVLALMAGLYKYQDKLLYFPVIPGAPKKTIDNPRGYRSPREYGVDFDDLYFTTADEIKIHAWLLKQEDSKSKPTIVFFHGNAGNEVYLLIDIGFRLPNAIEMYRRLESNIMLVDYRGYGMSEGDPTEEGLLLDAEAALFELRRLPYINPSSILLFGRSLGGAVALALAEKHPEMVHAAILENTFLDIPSMVDHLMPYLSPLKGVILRIKWSNHERIRKLAHPILFFAGEKDELVPHHHMKSLYEAATKSVHKKWIGIQEGTHNDTWARGGSEYYIAFREFIEKVTQIKVDNPEIVKYDLKEVDQSAYIPSMLESKLMSHTKRKEL